MRHFPIAAYNSAGCAPDPVAREDHLIAWTLSGTGSVRLGSKWSQRTRLLLAQKRTLPPCVAPAFTSNFIYHRRGFLESPNEPDDQIAAPAKHRLITTPDPISVAIAASTLCCLVDC